MPPKPKQPNLTDEQRNAVIADLLDASIIDKGKRKLARGAVKMASEKFRRSERTIRNIWNQAQENRVNIGSYTANSQIKSKSGRREVYNREELLEEMEELRHTNRGTVRDLAQGLGVSKSTIHKLIRVEKVIYPHSNALLPLLTEQDMLTRFFYARSRLETGENVFKGAFDKIHVDEKWFFITEIALRTYLTANEKAKGKKPVRRCQHKSHIMKVMFLAAVARPRFNDNGECTFDGKTGIYPIVEQVQAQRSSINRPRGTLEWKPRSLTREVYTEIMINKVLPDAIAKWPRDRGVRTQKVYIQQDNPHTHFPPTCPIWIQAKDSDPRFKFDLREQPRRSPDTNVLDLGFFRSLQSLQWQQPPATTVEGLMNNVKAAWEQYNPTILNRIWLSHQLVCDRILAHHGNNDFNIPHIGKERLERAGKLPVCIELSDDAKREISNYDLESTVAA